MATFQLATGTLEQNGAIVNVTGNTCAFPTVRSENVHSEVKKL